MISSSTTVVKNNKTPEKKNRKPLSFLPLSLSPSNSVAKMDFQVVILAGGFSSNLQPLVSKVSLSLPLIHLIQSFTEFRLTANLLLSAVQEIPKALLPVANRPVLSYVLDLLESSNLKDLIVVRLIISLHTVAFFFC